MTLTLVVGFRKFTVSLSQSLIVVWLIFLPSVVKLVQNFRSHGSILEYPNRTFYRNELQACADPIITESLTRFDELVTPGFPIIFHAISGPHTLCFEALMMLIMLDALNFCRRGYARGVISFILQSS